MVEDVVDVFDDDVPALDESVGLVMVEDGAVVEGDDDEVVEGDVVDGEVVEGEVVDVPDDVLFELGVVCARAAPPKATAPATTSAVSNGLRRNEVTVSIKHSPLGYNEIAR